MLIELETGGNVRFEMQQENSTWMEEFTALITPLSRDIPLAPRSGSLENTNTVAFAKIEKVEKLRNQLLKIKYHVIPKMIWKTRNFI